MKVMNGLMMTLEEDKRFFMYLAALLSEWRLQDIDQVLLHEIIFFFSVYSGSSSEVLAKIASVQSKLPTAACWSRQKKRGNCEVNLFYVESSFGTTDTTDKSFTVFFAHWGIKFYCQVKISARWVKIIWPLSCMSCRDEGKACNHTVLWIFISLQLWYDLWCLVAWRLKFQ